MTVAYECDNDDHDIGCQCPGVPNVITRIRELHKPRWDNCINACCSGEQCRLRTRVCEHDYDEWPCDTARLIYTADELT